MRDVVMRAAGVVSRVGGSLGRASRGHLVAALAFACGAGLAYGLGPAPRTKRAVDKVSPATVPPAPCEAAAPPAVAEAEPAGDDYDEEEWGTRELQEWKNRHSGAPLPVDYASTPGWSKPSHSKVVILPSGRSLVGAHDTLHALDAERRVVWKYTASQPLVDFAYVGATGMIYVTAGDNNMAILDASGGRELLRSSRPGGAGFGAVLPYGADACLVMDEFSGYRAGYTGVEASAAPMQDGVTAWRGTRMLWRGEVPPDAELQVVGSRVYAVTRTKTRILLREIKVPKGGRRAPRHRRRLWPS